MTKRNRLIETALLGLILVGTFVAEYFIRETNHEPHASLVFDSGITYRGDARPIFRKKCAACHNGNNALPNLLVYETAYSLRQEIKERVQTNEMPHIGRLSASEKDRIILWIDSGAKE